MAAFEIPADDSGEVEFFEFTLPGSRAKYRLKTMDFLDAGTVADLNDPAHIIRGMFSAAADAKSLEAIRSLSRTQAGALLAAWTKESGIEPGESSAS